MTLSDEQRAQLAARLRQTRRPVADGAYDPVVELTAGPAGTPVFAMHAVDGTVHPYLALARQLAPAGRVRGIEAAGVRGAAIPATTLAEMADRYAAAARQAQPVGPYNLLGWSMGGVIAFETARRLTGLGEQVRLLVLLDVPYLAPPSYADTEEHLAALFVHDSLRASGGGGEPAAVRGTVEEQLHGLAQRLDPGAGTALADELRRRYAVFRAHTSALAGYFPQAALDADALLIRARGSKDSTIRWSGVINGEIRVRSTEADHYSCLRPPAVIQIAEEIREVL